MGDYFGPATALTPGGYTYAQSTDPTVTHDVGAGETWFVEGTDPSHSFDAGDAAVYTGSGWRELSLADFSELSGTASPSQIDTLSASKLSDVSADSAASAHHTRFSDDAADALSAIPNRPHSDLSDSPSGAHHAKTSQASELSDVSADSVAEAHHAKTPEYTDADSLSAAASDDTKITYGAGPDFAVRYDSADDELVWSDEVGADDVMGVDKTGNLSLQGTLTESTTV